MSDATLERDGAGWMLEKDGTQLSYVAFDPRNVNRFPYVVAICGVLDRAMPTTATVLHIGGGALAIPRYIGACWPGSVNMVVDPDEQINELVEEELPWPVDFNISVLALDGMTALNSVSEGARDVIILDAFNGFEVPVDLRSERAFKAMYRALKPNGFLIANVILEAEEFTDTLGGVFGHAMIIEVEGGNRVLVAGKEE